MLEWEAPATAPVSKTKDALGFISSYVQRRHWYQLNGGSRRMAGWHVERGDDLAGLGNPKSTKETAREVSGAKDREVWGSEPPIGDTKSVRRGGTGKPYTTLPILYKA